MSLLKFQFNKLVRDKVPDELERQGVKLHYSILNSSNRIPALKNKLVEEVEELILSQSKVDILSELCDIYDILEVLHRLFGFVFDDNSDALSITLRNAAFEELLRSVHDDLSLENYNEYFLKISKVLNDIMRDENIVKEEIIQMRKDKNDLFGGFLLGIFVHYAEVSIDNHNAIKYCTDQPKKYPIIE